jgi:hypothetical protein
VLRLVEIALFLAPFAAFLTWRLLMPDGLSRAFLIAWAGVLIVLGAALAWLSQEDTLPPGATYVPSHIENGVVVPGHGGTR